MLARSLIVLLVVLNLGVAIWWLARDDAPPVPVEAELPAGAARLQLLREATVDAAATPSPAAAASPSVAAAPADPPPAALPGDGAAAAAPVEQAPAASLQCYALGPFPDADKLAAARRQLQPRVARLHVREVPSTVRRDWRVWLPPQADHAAAQALVARITAAGFSDYYIVATGEEANSIALGLYGSEASARRHQDALHAAGFTGVRAEALGDAPPSAVWIDVASSAPLAAADGQALGAAEVEPVDCSTVPATPAAATG